MGFLGKLLGRKPARPAVSGGGISLYQLTLQQGQTLSTRRCGIDGKSFACPSITHTVMTADISRFTLDVGGYCPTCGAFRCHDHVEFKAKDAMTYGVFCRTCGSLVAGVS